ncbi:LPS export ABC transporter periplasmic protein LptC [Mucilaginibacter sp. KACC 22063]|uniref:LPS export ABC transporter periplasmic protein LptC n=1 Tax=Mucilaginibacter sp. KACC 22063 TaxID=3025666 RepID=UPI002365106B|nr:LPS export ABC transporter periplasmic protein LptC [Mucilaginibacter sp. KACC 22063]WDF55082.1 LPS export ABC transporter periplasmic protein LptC [Mucilaginibacter sp. KACC 22063]
MKKIQEISAKEVSSPVERSLGVEVLYSDSAKVKAKLITPLMLHYKVSKPYMEMPKGVKIIFYDVNLNVTSTITSDYAIYQEGDKKVELDKNVVAVNEKGDVFKSEQLKWDQATRKVVSDKPVTITTKDGTVINGSSLVTNEKFSPWDIPQTTGTFHVNQNISQ